MDAETVENLKVIIPLLISLLTVLAAWAATRRTREETKKTTQDTIREALAGQRRDIELLWEQNKLTQNRADKDKELLDASNGKISQLFESLGQTKDELETKTNEFNSLLEAFEQLKVSHAAAQDEIQRLFKDLEKRVNKNAELQTLVDKLNDEVKRSQPLREEVAELNKRIGFLEKQIEAKDIEQRALLRTHENERREYQQRERDTVAENNRLREYIADRVTEINTLRETVAAQAEIIAGLTITPDTFMFADQKDADGNVVIKQNMESVPPDIAAGESIDNQVNEEKAS